MKHKFLLCIAICLTARVFGNPQQGSYVDENGSIEEGFVTFATASYFPILKVLLDSVKAFSTRPVVAFGINDDIPFSTEEYPFLIKRRLENLEYSIFYQKPRIILESGIRFGVYVEADDIVNEGVDVLFEWAKSVGDYPLCPIHPSDPEGMETLMAVLRVPYKSMHYVHAHVLFSYKCMPFIQEWYDHCPGYAHLAPFADESMLNVLLWKHGVTDYVDIYDPFYQTIRYFVKGEFPEGIPAYQKMYYYMLHGCKDPVEAKEILETLIAFSKEKAALKQNP